MACAGWRSDDEPYAGRQQRTASPYASSTLARVPSEQSATPRDPARRSGQPPPEAVASLADGFYDGAATGRASRPGIDTMTNALLQGTSSLEEQPPASSALLEGASSFEGGGNTRFHSTDDAKAEAGADADGCELRQASVCSVI